MNTIEIERKRIEALRHYEILDTPADGTFDRITYITASIFKVPICLISLVDEDRIWFKAKYGLNVIEVPRSPGLCASAILSDSPYVINNAILDSRSQNNPLVLGDPGLRFYAAQPLLTHDGYRLGTISIMDFLPGEFDKNQEDLLKNIAGLVMDQMELRLSARRAILSLSRLLNRKLEGPQLDSTITLCAWSKRIKIEDQWLTFEEFLNGKLGLSISHGMHPDLAKEMLKEPELN